MSNTLENLRKISQKINQVGEVTTFNSLDALRFIVESSIELIPNSSAVIYRMDPNYGIFEPESRVFASTKILPESESTRSVVDYPRKNGIGNLTIARKKRVITYEETGMDVHPYFQEQGVSAAACFPLLFKSSVLGVLYVYLYENRKFTELELITLEIYVNHAAMAIFHSRNEISLVQNLSQKENEVKQMQQATSLLFSRLRLDDTLHSILLMAMELTDAHYGIFRLVDEAKKHLITRSFIGLDLTQPKTEALPIDESSVMGLVAVTKKPVLLTDITQQRPDSYYPLDGSLTMRSELAIPLINSNGGLEGVLNLESPLVSAFDAHHQFLIQSLATTAIIAIQEFRLLEFFVDIAANIFKTSCSETLTYLTKKTNYFVNSRLCEIWRFENGELNLEATSSSSQALQVTYGFENQKINKHIFSDLEELPGLDLISHYARNKKVSTSNSLYTWIQFKDSNIPPRLMIICGSSKESENYGLRNDWNLRILNFIQSYMEIAIQNEERNVRLTTEQEQRMVAETFAAVGDIASNVLHNVNNKVGLIPVKVQSLRSKRRSLVQDDEYLKNTLDDIEKFSSDAMKTVSKNLLNLRPISLGPVDIRVVIEQIRQGLTDQPGIVLESTFSKLMPKIIGNEQSLHFVLTNLIDNAIEAMKGQGHITIRTDSDKNFVKIILSDDGPGISEDVLVSLFEFEKNNHSVANGKNIGFGLWWVKTILTRLGGAISVHSLVGEGTKFTLLLPIWKGPNG